MSSTTNFVQSEFRYDEGKSPLALLAETCRNIGVDTTTRKSVKSSIDHVKSSTHSSSSSSSLSSSSSSSSTESSSRKNNDSCRLSVSPLRNATPVSPTSRTSANSVNVSNSNNNNNNNNVTTHNVNGSTTSNHSSLSLSSSTGSYIGNGLTSITSESNKCSFKPYEDHITSKKKCLEDSRNRSSATDNDNTNTRNHNSDNNKHHYSANKDNDSVSKNFESNRSNKRDNVKSSPNNLSNSTSSSSSTSTTTSTSSSNTVNSSSTTTAHANHSSSLIKGSNCNGCLPPHPPSSTPHPLTVDNVAKFVPYPSLSPYLGLHSPSAGYDPASVAALAAAAARMSSAAAAGHCHSPSMCRDPFCAGCRFSATAANVLGQISACPAGCTQCSHVSQQMTPSMSHQIAALQASGYLPGNAFYPPPPTHHHSANPPISTANSVAAAAAAAAVAASNANNNLNKSNICSWVIGNSFCGKRFTSSEELHQHLRNHTSSVSALALLCQYPHLSPIPGLRKTAFDPVNRYHPYKPLTNNGSPLNSLPNGITGPIPGLTSHTPSPGSQLNMHYPAYGPYAGRLGPPIPP